MKSEDDAAPPGLRWADTGTPGLTRRRAGKGWVFVDADGNTVRCADTRRRLLSLAVPPAYRDVWYCPDPDGHIQAVGFDARGRRQYRYHPDFRENREADKFSRLALFGNSLPAIRAETERALRQPALTRERVIAAVVRLLDLGQLRVGNSSYARENGSFGATTLRRRHVAVEGASLRLRFKGKGGIERRMTLTDRALARTVRACQDIPGQQLFSWEEADGSVRLLQSEDVNAWLKEVTGLAVTAKQFRTWWASVIALECWENNPGETLKTVMTCVSARLGNTPAIARKSYVHPLVIDVVTGVLPQPPGVAGPRALSRPERRLMRLLKLDLAAD